MSKLVETDIVCVGGGVASLAAALTVMRTLKARGVAKLPRVAVIDKGRNPGSHVLSGAVIDPQGLVDVLTPEEIEKMPIEARVTREAFRMCFASSSMLIPWVPTLMQQKGFPVGSVTKLTAYLAHLCEKEGVDVFTGFACVALVKDDTGRVIGVRTGDKGVDACGKPKSNFTAGEEIRAKVVVLGEGGAGILTNKLLDALQQDATRPQTYALGIKEVIEVPANDRMGEIAHTFGYPCDATTYGGGFIYHVAANQVMVGYVYALDYSRAEISPHELFRRFKAHPAVQAHIDGGKSVAYGAKVIPEGGALAVPDPVADGVMIVGDGAGLVDTLRIKGVHIAMQSGKAAGETLADCWEHADFSRTALMAYRARLEKTSGWREMKRVQNVRAAFSKHLLLGVMAAGFAWLRLPFPTFKLERDSETLKPLDPKALEREKACGVALSPTSPDRLTDVFLSGTIHDEDQPCHLKIKDPSVCATCLTRYGAPCQRFCPAEVYRVEDGKVQIDFSNCMHCKTCQIKDPFGNIEWTFPQGGDGPRWTRM